MTVFGLYEGRSQEPFQQFDGEFLVASGESVVVMVNTGGGSVQGVAVIRLEEGQLVRKVTTQK
jgi:hypothetical protein